jgi:hypothetical protein
VALYLDTRDRGDLPQAASVARPMQAVEHAIGARGGQQLRQLATIHAAFWEAFDRRVSNQRIVEAAHLIHGLDGVLRSGKVAR